VSEAGQVDAAILDRYIQFEAETGPHRRCGDRAREVTEVRRRTPLEVDEAVVSPSTQMRQPEQPGGGPGILHLEPGEHLICRLEGCRSGVIADGGLGDGMKQHQVLTQLRLAHDPDRLRIIDAPGQRSERSLG
jgi:hypothetical protein